MAAIDLIPASYREQVRTRKLIVVTWRWLGAAVVIGTVAIGVVTLLLHSEEVALAGARQSAGSAEALRLHVEQIRARKSVLENSASVLTALKGSGELSSIMRAVDEAISPAVWLAEMQYKREAQPIDVGQPKPVSTPGVLVIDAPLPATGAPALRLTSSVEFRGGAMDHAAMAAFVKALSRQQALLDVRFLNSSVISSELGRAATVEFGAAAAVRQNWGAQP